MKYLIIIICILGFQKGMTQITNPGTVVNNAATNHVNNDVNNATESGLNKIENGLKGLFKKKTKPNAADSAKAVAAAAKLKDSLSLIKAKYDSIATKYKNLSPDSLSRMNMGAMKQRISISSADSAAAINSFKTGNGGNGLLYEYLVTTNSKQMKGNANDTMSMMITDEGNSRMNMGISGNSMETINHADNPKFSIQLFPKYKAYSLNIIDTGEINTTLGLDYTVTKLGAETVNGYYCIHSKLTIKMGNQQDITEDVWTSTDVPGYSMMKKKMISKNITPKMLDVLDKAGCGGFFVKMDMQSSYISMSMNLITAAHKTFPASLFQIPSGYSAFNSSNFMQQFQ